MFSKAKKLGYPVKKTTLKFPKERYMFGDYLIGRRNQFALIMERKTWSDLQGSIKDERFFRQIFYMNEVAEEYGLIPFLFIEGSVREWRTKEKQRIMRMYKQGKIDRIYEPSSIARIEGAITSAHVRVLTAAPSVIIRHVTNSVQTLNIFYSYAQRIADGQLGMPRPRRIKKVNRRFAFQKSALATLFDITDRQAANILDEYETLHNFLDEGYNSNISKVKGLGSVAEKKIKGRLKMLKS
jgi:ERCC4-type nuclease